MSSYMKLTKYCEIKLHKIKLSNASLVDEADDILTKTAEDIEDMKRKHDEIIKSFENILGYLSTDRCEIKELDHQKLEELSFFLVKGVNLFSDLSDHIEYLQKCANTSEKYEVPKTRVNEGKYYLFCRIICII